MNRGRVLIVDDQQEILNAFHGILSEEGYEVLAARDGQEAIHLVQSDAPDVVFLDIWIPGIDGMQTLRAIKRIDPGCSVIMMSGHGTIETAVKAIKLGATDYLEKPLNLDDVLHLVEKSIVAGRSGGKHEKADLPLPARLIGNSDMAQHLRRTLEEAAEDAGSVWLVGDEGTGKEFVARIIHHIERKDRDSLIKVRCSELNSENFDQVLLGKNDTSGTLRPGKISQASDGTLLLIRMDRIEESVRSRLADLLHGLLSPTSRSGRYTRFRGRIVSTSAYDPQVLVRDQGFPSALVEVLSHRVIRIPGLSERTEDIPLFVEHFLKEAADEFDREELGIEEEAMGRLMGYPWPGNVKELKILIEHVVMTAPGRQITVNDLLIPGQKHLPPIDAGASGSGLQKRSAGGGPAATSQTRVVQEASVGSASRLDASRTARFQHQKTLRGKVVMYGQGLHSGVKTGLTLSPLPPGSGILFGHITSGGAVPATLDNVESTELSTSLKGNGSSAKTIEHLMAVFHVYGLTNVLVKTSGEVPIMDGSALEFCGLVESAEIIRQDEMIEEIQITEPLDLPFPAQTGKSLRVEPSDYFEVEYFLHYPPPVGSMHMVYRCQGPEDFKAQIACARTFGFVKDMRMLDKMGLAGGGRLSNVVLLDEEKVVNPPLRFPDEFVRHKILDIIGDFYLLGRPFRGKVIARQTGHTDNIAMMKLISENMGIAPS